MNTMKAIRIHRRGGPEVLVYEDAPIPALHRATRWSASMQPASPGRCLSYDPHQHLGLLLPVDVALPTLGAPVSML